MGQWYFQVTEGPDPMGLCLLISDICSVACLFACSATLPPTSPQVKYCSYPLTNSVTGAGWWTVVGLPWLQYHHPWSWLPSRQHAATSTCTTLADEFNPFTPESDQCQNSPAASQQIWHHTVWRIWLFIAYADERWLYYKFSLHHAYNCFLKGWENTGAEVLLPQVRVVIIGLFLNKFRRHVQRGSLQSNISSTRSVNRWYSIQQGLKATIGCKTVETLCKILEYSWWTLH